jgi:transcriptional regulator NrdR family protein
MSTSSGITIVKASGERDVFSESKLRDSLQRSGAGEKAINRVVAAILDELYEGMPTRKIYRRAYQLLRKESHLSATRYNLKQAVMDLGPSGYPFEALIGRLLEKMGYTG